MSKNLLVMAGGRRVYVVRELVQTAPPGTTVHVSDLDPWAPAQYVHGAVPIPQDRRAADPDAWLDESCRKYDISGVLSLHDYEGYWLAQRAGSLGVLGQLFIGPDAATARILVDKAGLYDHLANHAPELAIPTYLWDGHGHRPSMADGNTPWIVKDRFGSGSSGLRICPDTRSVEQGCAENSRRIGWHPEAYAAHVESVIQPYLRGTEFNVDLFFDRDGGIRGHCVKEKHSMRDGETDAARVFRHAPADILAAATRATKGLALMGNVDIDILKDENGRLSVLDINPRFGGGYAFSQMAGYRVAHAVWSILFGSTPPSPLAAQRDVCAAKHLEVETVPMTLVREGGKAVPSSRVESLPDQEKRTQ